MNPKNTSARKTLQKIKFKPGNMLYPLPAVIVSCGEYGGDSNLLTVAWTGTVCTNPPMVYISVRPERHSYAMIRQAGEFVINLTTEQLACAADYCGVRSGRDHDKWADCSLTPIPADTVACPLIAESPVNIECKVEQVQELGSHHMFLARVTAVQVDARYMDENNIFHLEQSGLLAYSHGTYFGLGEALGNFGYSIRRKPHTPRQADTGKASRGKAPKPKQAGTGKASCGKAPKPKKPTGRTKASRRPQTGH